MGRAQQAAVVEDSEVQIVVVSEDTSEAAVIEAAVGEEIIIDLTHPDGRAVPWQIRSGPPGLYIQSDGTIEYEAGPDDVGRWWIDVVYGSAFSTRIGGFELRITEPDGSGIDEDSGIVKPILPKHAFLLSKAAVFDIHCALSVGVTSGAVYQPGSIWAHPGIPTVSSDLAPQGAAHCGLGQSLRTSLGLELTPTLALGGRHTFGAIYSGIDLALGQVVAGLYLSLDNHAVDIAVRPTAGEYEWLQGGLGGGARLALPRTRIGSPEIRAVWADPIGVRGVVAWSFALAGDMRD